jgi:hypothetical protein
MEVYGSVASLQSVPRWDDETDVLVLGLGLAGAVAAIKGNPRG